ncbi:zinc transport system substrate-binding protein [Bacillus pakistanensis]|uniref:Zinc transport system substrate-binding protein n=1 Tax=Rossellomorea pakistanensis TaxID=992288 RepID=A0ABS2NKG7_9BACI|nr:zinc ABC transporter substrate-binding protein [Bacillus pakistanensis]MBM7588357.1 zinc transport system substrate-binding protein [Bacillus pakistanensis]
MKIIKGLFIIATILLLAACTDNQDKNNDESFTVYTTVYPLEDFAKKIGGDHVDVHSIYPPGADEHTFEPSQKDMMDLADADLFLYIGLGLEGFVNKAEDILKNENVTMIATAEGLALEEESHVHENDHSEEAHHHDLDPHVWLDPIYSKELAHKVYEELAEKLPKHKEELKKNYNQLVADLDQLDQQFKKVVENAERNEIFVSHAAYSYWEKRYGIKQTSIAGISSSDEPSQQELKDLIDSAKQKDVQYILFEQNISSRLTEVVQKEIGAEALPLHNLSVRTEEEVKEEKDYFDLMNENIETLTKALNSKE